MKAIQAKSIPLSSRYAMLVLCLVFLTPATSSGQTVQYTQTFESYDIGTSAADTENAFSAGVWDNATVVNGGSKELCVTPDPFGNNTGSFGFGGSDFLPPIEPIPCRDVASASFSFDFRVQTVGTAFTDIDNTRIATGVIWENSSNNIWTSLFLNSENELFLYLGDSSVFPIASSNRPFDDLEFDLDSPGEWSNYFSLQLNLQFDNSPGSGSQSGIAVANLVDSAGNVLLSTSKEIFSSPIVSPATGMITAPSIFMNEDSFNPLFATCYDNLSHSVTFVSATLIGDVNRDCEVNFSDIAPLISILASGGYLAQADANQDGVVDFSDIPPFIEALSSQ